jgi:hypothetical protein
MFLQKKAIAIFAILFLCFPGVMAVQRVSFAEPDTLTHKDVYMYYANGSLVGMYNTTSPNIVIPNDTEGDFMFVIKPQYSSPIDDPGAWLSSFLSWTSTNAIALIFSFAIIGFLFVRR